MRAASFISLSIYLVIGCADRSQVSDETGETGTGDNPTTTTSTDPNTESGDDEPVTWVYESPIQPNVLDASADGVIVGGLDSDDRAVVYALDTFGDLLWTSEWDEDSPYTRRAVDSIAWTPSGTWVGLYYGSCGDWCVSEGVVRLDPQGVEQARADLDVNILEIEALDGDAIVLGRETVFSYLYRVDSDGSVVWDWIGYDTDVLSPAGTGLEIIDGDIWVFGILGTQGTETWLGRYDADAGELVEELLPELATGTRYTTRLADGLAVTTGGGVAALALDGTSAWYVQLPDSSCALDGDVTSLLIGCPTELQLRDRDGALLSIWDGLESTTDSYEWRDVALGTRIYAAIADRDAQLPGRVYGIPLE